MAEQDAHNVQAAGSSPAPATTQELIDGILTCAFRGGAIELDQADCQKLAELLKQRQSLLSAAGKFSRSLRARKAMILFSLEETAAIGRLQALVDSLTVGQA